jgi:hypothetical protein
MNISPTWGFSEMFPMLDMTPLPRNSSVGEGSLIEDFDEVRMAGAERGVRVAFSVGGAHEHHFLTGDEFAHRRIDTIEHPMLVEGAGLEALAVFFLKLVLAGRARQDFRLRLGR